MGKLMRAMTRGDLVTCIALPAWGVGIIRRIEPDGRLLVDFEIDGRAYSDDFAALELEIARPALKRVA